MKENKSSHRENQTLPQLLLTNFLQRIFGFPEGMNVKVVESMNMQYSLDIQWRGWGAGGSF